MNLHSLAFVSLFILFASLTLRRSSWGIPLYMLTLYASPMNASWAWALQSTGIRWTLMAAFILFVGVLLGGRKNTSEPHTSVRPVLLLLLFYALNASCIHFFFADNRERSWVGLCDLWKQVGLAFLLLKAIKDPFDLKLMLYSILLGGAYIGYEVVFNDSLAIDFDGRLWPRLGGQIGNHVSAQLAMSLPLGAYFVFYGNRRERIAAVASLALIVELVLRAASRGAFLGLIAGAWWLVLRTKGRPRIYAIVGILSGVLAVFPALDKEDQAKVFKRYFSTFAVAEDRDASAASRINFWQAGVTMIADHPLGSGFEAAFESDLGATYVEHLDLGRGRNYRSVHNGYLDIAASWGIHGLILFLAALGVACLQLNRSTRSAFAAGNTQVAFLGCCFQTAIIVLLMSSITGSNLKGDGYIWSIAMMLSFARLAPVFTLGVSHSQSNGATDSNGTNAECRSWELVNSSRAASC